MTPNTVFQPTQVSLKQIPLCGGAGPQRNRTGSVWPEQAPTVAELARGYLADRRGKVKQSTLAAYDAIIAKHILPALGECPITALTEAQVSGFFQNLAYAGEGEPLAAATIKGIITPMNGILHFTERIGWNTADRIQVRFAGDTGRETRVLSKQEQRALKEYCAADMNTAKFGVMLCLFTGLRIGELCALKWSDVSLEQRTLMVRRTIQRIKNLNPDGDGGKKTKIIFDAPKSKSANRCIPIPNALYGCMRKFQAERNCFVMTGKPDVWMEPRALQNAFRNILSNAGVAPINFHALRHTFATNCVEQGIDIKTLSRIMGHSDVSVTLNTYVHPSLSMMRKYMDRLT